jgi:hypothetical protein
MLTSMEKFTRYRAPHEVKFLVSSELAARIRAWASEFMERDPYTAPELNFAYRVKSIYLDTPLLDVFQRNGSYARGKFRIREYAPSGILFLERKMKAKGIVRKRRTTIGPADLQRLHGTPLKGWEGFWYHRRIALRGLQPVCTISYLRYAFLSLHGSETIRLTLDQELNASRRIDFDLNGSGEGMRLLNGRAILELKYVGEAPALFKQLADTFQLNPEPVSKYRLAIPALGLAPQKGSDAPTELLSA